MKIGFLITYFYPKIGGAENNCYYLAKELAKKHDVYVFCSGDEEKEETIENIKVHRSKEIFRFKYYFALYPSITQKLISANLDVLHVHGLGFPQHDKAISALKSIHPQTKIICTPHGPFMALKNGFFKNLIKKIYTRRIKSNIKNYDAFVQVNPYQKEWMISEYRINPEKIFFVPNGIPKEAFSKAKKKSIIELKNLINLKKDEKIISYVGRIQKYKGLDIPINSIKALPKEVKLVLAGKDGGDMSRLNEIVKTKGMEERIFFLGEVSEDMKIALLELSEIFVFPSEWEAFGISTLEAMAKGNAIVASDTEGARYLLENKKNGFIVSQSDEEGFTKSLITLIENPSIQEKMSKLNKKKASVYLWKKISDRLEKLYSSTLS